MNVRHQNPITLAPFYLCIVHARCMVSVTVLIFNFPNGCDAPSALLNKNARNFDLKVRYNAALNLTHDIPFNSISIAFLVHY